MSDPWTYLRIHIEQEMRARKEQALYYLELAREHNEAAQDAARARPLLLYYSYLNLVKTYLVTTGTNFKSIKNEYHGLAQKNDGRAAKVHALGTPPTLSVFPSFVNAIDGAVPAATTLLHLKRLLPANIEIHALAVSSGIVPKWNFVQVEPRIAAGPSGAWLEVLYEKRERNRITDLFGRFYASPRKQALFFVGNEKAEGDAESRLKTIFQSRTVHPYATSIREVYPAMVAEAKALGLRSILTRQGYRYYVQLDRWKYGQLPTAFATMFVLGSMVRYHPKTAEEVFEGPLAGAVSEFLSLNPQQFIYHLSNAIIGRECVLPMARL